MFQEVSLLPAKVIVRHIQYHFMMSIRINSFGRHTLSAKMHVRRISQDGYIFRQSVTGSDPMIGIVGWDQEQIIPDFVLANLVFHRLFSKHQADTGAVFNIIASMVAVVNLKLQVRSRWNSQRVARRASLG